MKKYLILPLAVLTSFAIEFSSAQTLQSTPKISANSLFLFRNSNLAKEDNSLTRNGFDIQETELAFFSDVDPHTKLNIILTVVPEYELNTIENKIEKHWHIEPEVAYAETQVLENPNLKFGKIKASFGKHNTFHTHAYPFIEAPLTQTSLLGDEGFTDLGISASFLLPTNWFSEVNTEYFRGEAEGSPFNSPTPSDGVGLLHWKNLWDISENMTFEIGASYAQGKNSNLGETVLSGLDFTMKWRPLAGGKLYSFVLSAERIESAKENPTTATHKSKGYNLWAQGQISERWTYGMRHDLLEDHTSGGEDATTRKGTASIIYRGSEFANYRIETYQTYYPASVGTERLENGILLQANFTIGAHPNHGY
jgi:hypothetical protein